MGRICWTVLITIHKHQNGTVNAGFAGRKLDGPLNFALFNELGARDANGTQRLDAQKWIERECNPSDQDWNRFDVAITLHD